MDTTKHIIDACKTILEENHSGDHTMPAPNLYPHQWLWDSCFISIGVRHFDPDRAVRELRHIVKGQWSNGMIPHMIFQSDKKYRQDREIWMSAVSPYSPDAVSTSGITQPPVLAEAMQRVGQKLTASKRKDFYKSLLPHLISYHEWLMTERDPHDEGLVLQIHPWETGLDNNPVWMNQLHEHNKPWWIAAVEKLRLDGLVNILRRDTRHVPPGQRISNTEALMVFDLIRRFKRKSYDTSKILHRSLFCIEDIGFNSILARNNALIIECAAYARIKIPQDFHDKVTKQAEALQKCWDDDARTFYSRDFISHDLIKNNTISSLLPLYSGVITKEQAQHLVDDLLNKKTYYTHFPIPSVPLNNLHYSPLRYWQGPTWVNTNWLLVDGLRRYGFDDLANDIKHKTIDLVALHGPYEYFSPSDGTPLGASEFSWSAALTIDFLHS